MHKLVVETTFENPYTLELATEMVNSSKEGVLITQRPKFESKDVDKFMLESYIDVCVKHSQQKGRYRVDMFDPITKKLVMTSLHKEYNDKSLLCDFLLYNHKNSSTPNKWGVRYHIFDLICEEIKKLKYDYWIGEISTNHNIYQLFKIMDKRNSPKYLMEFKDKVATDSYGKPTVSHVIFDLKNER